MNIDIFVKGGGRIELNYLRKIKTLLENVTARS